MFKYPKGVRGQFDKMVSDYLDSSVDLCRLAPNQREAVVQAANVKTTISKLEEIANKYGITGAGTHQNYLTYQKKLNSLYKSYRNLYISSLKN